MEGTTPFADPLRYLRVLLLDFRFLLSPTELYVNAGWEKQKFQQKHTKITKGVMD